MMPWQMGMKLLSSPPSRAAEMSHQILSYNFDPWQYIANHQQRQLAANKYGAAATFVGTMRDFNDDATVHGMTLEHYPAMTTRYLEKLEQEARQRWELLDCLIIHRVGDIQPNDAIVAIACWSAHRRAALDACAWLIETLKHQAPFWKQEMRAGANHWVTHNTDGH